MKVTLDMEEGEPIILSKDDGWRFVPGNSGDLVAIRQTSESEKSLFIVTYLTKRVTEYTMDAQSDEMKSWIDHKKYRKITHE